MAQQVKTRFLSVRYKGTRKFTRDLGETPRLRRVLARKPTLVQCAADFQDE
jgi:hypothetical protein